MPGRIQHTPRFGSGLLLGLGLLIGLAVGSRLGGVEASDPLLASGIDRAGESIMTIGTIATQRNSLTGQVSERRALYLLDYATGTLRAMPIDLRTVGARRSLLAETAQRDLVTDFDLEPGSSPQFLMTTAPLNEGWAALVVVETKSRQIATYRLHPTRSGGHGGTNRFELLNRQPITEANSPITSNFGR